jgi:undecaprenyl diphosphate synthase
MDGNGRWAEREGVSVAEGHRAGTRALRRTVEAAIDIGIETLVVYAFSTENWARPADEVADLLVLLAETVDTELPDLAKQGVRSRFLGRRDRIVDAIRAKLHELEESTAHLDTLHLWIAFDYGGREELVEVARRLLEEGVDPERVDEQAIAQRLYAPELADLDLLVRTSGELRLSNFMLWEAAYAELVFAETLWPDFGEEQLRAAVDAYAVRERRFGGRNGA